MKRFLVLLCTLWAGIAQATVTGTVTENTYACNGSQTAYPTTFRFLAGTDLAVKRTTAGADTTLALTTDYTVTGAKAATGTVTLTAGSKCPNGSTLTITRTLPMTQGTAFRSQGSFSPALHEDAFDRLAMVDQQLERKDVDLQAQVNLKRDTAAQATRDAGQDANHDDLEAFVNGLAAGGQVVIPKTWTLAGDGTATTFALPAADLSSAASYYVTIDGLSQIPTADFSVSGGADTVTFTSAPPVGSVIEVRCLAYAKAQSVADGTTVTATGSTTARTLADRFSERINVKDFGAVPDDGQDDTTALRAALAAATATGAPVFVPPGVYLTDVLQLKTGHRLLGANNFGSGAAYPGAGAGASILKARTSGGHVIEIDGGGTTILKEIEIGHLVVAGYGGLGSAPSGTGHGIYVHDVINGGGSSLWIHDVQVSRVGGKGVYMPTEWHTTLERVRIDLPGDNAFELQGGNTTVLKECYAKAIKAGKVGYRIYGGGVTMISCNGIDYSNSEAGAYWGVFGSRIADGDAADVEFTGTLIGCNIEEGRPTGLLIKTNSRARFVGNTFSASYTTNSVALQFQGDPAPGQEIDDSNVFSVGGTATWKNGKPVHTPGFVAPMTKGRVTGLWSGQFNYTWDDLNGIARETPVLSVNQTYNALNIYPLSVARQDQASGSRIYAIRTNTKTWTPGSIANGASASTTVTIGFNSMSHGASAIAGFSQVLPPGCEIFAKVTADNTVTVTIYNWTGGVANLTSAGTLTVAVFHVGSM